MAAGTEHKLNSINQRNEPRHKKNVWQSGLGGLTVIHFLLFSGFSNVCHSVAFWPTALKLGCTVYFDMHFLVMGFISSVILIYAN